MPSTRSHRLPRAVLALAACISSSFVAAAPPVAVAPLSQQAADELKGLFAVKTGLAADTVIASPLPGFVEIDVGTTVYYMDTSGAWLIDGAVVDLATRASITGPRKAALERTSQPVMDWKALNFNDAIKTVTGKATPGRVVVTFEDPNCGFCKRLAPELRKVKDLTIFTFPVSILGSDSRQKNEAIWCSKDRTAAWAATMAGAPFSGGKPDCDLSSLERNTTLAQRLKVAGTPSMFFVDGTRAPGFLEAKAIEQRLQP